jgi:hypothetical protein
MPYRIAGIDVHKKMLAVVGADAEVEGDYYFERLKVGTSPAQLRALADWLAEREVEEVVMESTRSIGDLFGRRWSCTGDRSVGRARARPRYPGRSTSHKRSRIVAPAAARRTFPTRNVW